MVGRLEEDSDEESIACMLLSEESLKKDWLSKEDNGAWNDL